jgi:DNA invertase Pin-like site-specific DNA recombinase
MTTEIRYFLYARRSSESEDRQVASISAQVEELEKIARERGLNIVRVFTESKSAKAEGRPVFNEMMRRVAGGEAQGIVCWKLDRLARNFIDGGKIIEMIQGGAVQHIQTFSKGYFPNDNVLMMSVEFGVAKQFIKDLSDNTKRGLKRKADAGWLPSRAPIGYKNEKYALQGEKRILVDEVTFSIIR